MDKYLLSPATKFVLATAILVNIPLSVEPAW